MYMHTQSPKTHHGDLTVEVGWSSGVACDLQLLTVRLCMVRWHY